MRLAQIGALSGGNSSSGVPFGIILNDDFSRAVIGSDYSVIGGTFSPNSTDMDVAYTGPTTSVYTDRLDWLVHPVYGNMTNSFNEFVLSVRVRLTVAPSASTIGIRFGKHDYSSPDGIRSQNGFFNMGNGANGGKCFIQHYNGSYTTLATSAQTPLVMANGEWYTCVLEKSIVSDNRRYTCTVTKDSDLSQVSCSWDESLALAQSAYAFSTGPFSLWAAGASMKVSNWTITVADKRNVGNLFIGDSITGGISSDSLLTSFPDVYAPVNVAVSACGGDVTERVVQKLDNIVSYNPSKIFLMIGGNDLNQEIANETWQGNLDAIVARIHTDLPNAQLIHLLYTPRNDVDVTPLHTYINANYSDDTIVDVYTPLKGTGTDLHADYDPGDGVHPNEAGHALIAQTITSAL